MAASDVGFLFDVDNTLLESDRVKKDLRRYLESELGAEKRTRSFAVVEERRAALGYTDCLDARKRYHLQDRGDPRLLTLGMATPTGGKG